MNPMKPRWPHPYPETGRLLATFDGWELRARDKGRHSFVLMSPLCTTGKRKFYGAWNGGRAHASRTYDMPALAARYPAVHAWLMQALSKGALK